MIQKKISNQDTLRIRVYLSIEKNKKIGKLKKFMQWIIRLAFAKVIDMDIILYVSTIWF